MTTQVILEAIPVGDGETFIHFTYSYAYGFAGKVALRAYLEMKRREHQRQQAERPADNIL